MVGSASANRFDERATAGEIMNRHRIQRILDVSLAAVVVVGSAAGWSCSKRDPGGSAGAAYTIWDPYPQLDALSNCG